MPCFLVGLMRMIFCPDNGGIGSVVAKDSDNGEGRERDIVGRVDTAEMEKETENVHRAVARTISSVLCSESARKSPGDQTLLMCAERAEGEMVKSLAAIGNRVPGFLPMQHARSFDPSPARLQKASGLIF